MYNRMWISGPVSVLAVRPENILCVFEAEADFASDSTELTEYLNFGIVEIFPVATPTFAHSVCQNSCKTLEIHILWSKGHTSNHLSYQLSASLCEGDLLAEGLLSAIFILSAC
jgi:hypothetical protein